MWVATNKRIRFALLDLEWQSRHPVLLSFSGVIDLNVIEFLYFLYDRNEEAACVLVVRHHTQTVFELFSQLGLVVACEHGLLDECLLFVLHLVCLRDI